MGYNEQAILKSLIYADIFHFPLTDAELWHYLISERNITRREFSSSLHTLLKKKMIGCTDGYYHLPTRTRDVPRRRYRAKASKKKLLIARRVALRIAGIPTVFFVGVSGSLAMSNAGKADDIDLFIITKTNRLFTTRLMVLLLLEKMGIRRKRNEKYVDNKICVNLLIDESEFIWPIRQRDVYTAHEIAQLIPLFDREQTYERFLLANPWVKKFLPNAKMKQFSHPREQKISLWVQVLCHAPVELPVRVMQIYYLRQHQTNENVGKTKLFFHPLNYRLKVLRLLSLRMTKAGLLTKV